MRINLRKDNGITLIALIVTIIILIILAGISIGTLTGDNGLIKQAQTAKTETERSDIEEKINVIVIDNSKEREMDKDKLINDFENKLPDGKEIVDSDNLIYIIYPEYSFEVDIDSGDVKETEIEKVEDETPWELAGSGTEEDPYLIESIEDLVAFSNSVNNGNDYWNKYVKLTTDLDFNLPFSYDNPKTKVSEKTNRIIEEDSNGTELKELLTSGTGFNPIGSESKYFSGNFDGDGKEIKNIYINRPEEDYVALFGSAIGIKSVGVSGYIKGNKYVAGVVGNVLGKRGTVKYCYNKAEVIGKLAVGGVASYSMNCENCYNLGNIKIETSDNSESSDLAIGGIIANPQTSGYIKNCYNGGTIEVEKTYGAGGISGFFGNISNCYNLGEIKTLGTYKVNNIGGICSSSNNTFKINNCYNTANLLNCNSYHIGGILGMNDSMPTLEENYYLKGSTTGGVDGEDIEGAMPLEKSKMPSVISVLMTDNEKVEWNGEMVDVWKKDTNNINNGYPILYWE